MQEQVQPVGSGTDGTVETAWNTKFGHHVYKWSSQDVDLDKEARALLLLRGPHVVQCYGLCRENPTICPPRHAGRRGLIMEFMAFTLWDAVTNPSKVK